MKNNKHKKPQGRVIKELAEHFEADLKKTLPITVSTDGSVAYKDYYVKLNHHKNWGLYRKGNTDEVDQFYLKTCAIMAAKAYNNTHLDKFFEIKRLDNRYWANYCDQMIYRHNIKTAKDYNRFLVLLNKLEHTTFLTEHYKEEISTMFKWSFV